VISRAGGCPARCRQIARPRDGGRNVPFVNPQLGKADAYFVSAVDRRFVKRNPFLDFLSGCHNVLMQGEVSQSYQNCQGVPRAWMPVTDH